MKRKKRGDVMKMEFIFSGLFWGIVVVLIGVSIIIKVVFHVDIPLFRIILGLILIYFGVRLIIGGWGKQTQTETVFASHSIDATNPKDSYSTVFGNTTLDLSSVNPEQAPQTIKIDTIFGDTKVLLNPAQIVEIKADAVFGRAHFPDGNQISFGSYAYRSSQKDAVPNLTIKSNTVFGNTEYSFKKLD